MTGKHVAPPTIWNSNFEALAWEICHPILGVPNGYKRPQIVKPGKHAGKDPVKE